MEFIWVVGFSFLWRKTEHSPFALSCCRKTERSALCAFLSQNGVCVLRLYFFIASFMRSFPSSFSQTLGAFSVHGRDK
jgi:hypothetical protein